MEFISEKWEMSPNGGMVKVAESTTPVVQVNQIIQLIHPMACDPKHVVIEIVPGGWSGLTYKTINLRTGEFDDTDSLKPLSQRFGIGFYYDDENPEFMEPAEVEMLKETAQALKDKRIAEDNAERKRRDELSRIGRERLEKLLPQDVKALIVAEYRNDESDLMTDLHAYTTGRKVILGISPHTRNNFNEMRKMALNCPDTVHLAEYNEENEHRENWSMGGGYYLGKSRYSGWIIQKDSCRTREGLISDYAETAGSEENICLIAPSTTIHAPQTVEVSGSLSIVDYSNKAIAVIGDTKPIKDTLSALGGRFNFRLTINGEKCCGWVFPKTKEQEVRTALSL